MEIRPLFPFTLEGRERRRADELYGAIVTQARAPAFYAESGVSDTPEGRASMVMLHVFLVLDRLTHAGRDGARLGRLLTEAFVTDMDDCMREMGVGDLTVPKKVKRAAAALMQRCVAYRRAAADDDKVLATELAATIPGLEAGGAGGDMAGAHEIAAYVRRAKASLAGIASEELLAGRVTFPEPLAGQVPASENDRPGGET